MSWASWCPKPSTAARRSTSSTTPRRLWFSFSGGGTWPASFCRSWMRTSKQSFVASLTRSMTLLELRRCGGSLAVRRHGEQLDAGAADVEGVRQVEGHVPLAHRGLPVAVLDREREVRGPRLHGDLRRRPVGDLEGNTRRGGMDDVADLRGTRHLHELGKLLGDLGLGQLAAHREEELTAALQPLVRQGPAEDAVRAQLHEDGEALLQGHGPQQLVEPVEQLLEGGAQLGVLERRQRGRVRVRREGAQL